MTEAIIRVDVDGQMKRRVMWKMIEPLMINGIYRTYDYNYDKGTLLLRTIRRFKTTNTIIKGLKSEN